ncbi:hypothetical protein KUCAC02_006242 [Chaenocephalus aceratus]|nr:hypothetical protein KUCAC02_006242 [Chaenocephalus aceratus]
MPSELSLWSVVEEGTGTCNGSADDEGMASEEETVDDGVRFKEGESSQGQHPPPRNPKPSCPLAALLGGERYGGGAQPKTNTQENQAKEQMTRYEEADLLEVKEDPLVWWKEHQGSSLPPEISSLLPDHVDQIIFLNKNLKRM